MRRTLARVAAVVLACGTTTAVLAGPAGAAPREKFDYSASMDGTWAQSGDSAIVTGSGDVYLPRFKEPMQGVVNAGLTPDDGTMPEPETCEPAHATIVVEGNKHVSETLTGDGQVCGVFPQDPFIVTHVFTGRYNIVDTAKNTLRKADGFFEIRLGLNSLGSAFSIDT